MQTIKQRVAVDFEYSVHFGSDLFEPSNPLLAEVLASGCAQKVVAVVDRGVAEHHPKLCDQVVTYAENHPDQMELVAQPLVVVGGEEAKNDSRLVDNVHRAIEHYHLDRHSYVLAIGGGAVLDMAGFAAATAHRGVRLIRVPTTVLSQNDSGVGVKNGINAFGKKNFLGTFSPPHAVINDPSFLSTLEDRDWRAGVSEAVKVALLKDPDFFAAIEDNASALIARDLEAMQSLIYRCAELHLEHIAHSGDPFEFGSSRPLDFGHWSAHKLESLSNYRLRHGEAVAAGICLDATYSHLAGLLDEDGWRRVLALFDRLQLPLWTPEFVDRIGPTDHSKSVLSGLEEFREHLGGELCVMLLEDIGRGCEVNAIDHALVEQSIRRLEDLCASSSLPQHS